MPTSAALIAALPVRHQQYVRAFVNCGGNVTGALREMGLKGKHVPAYTKTVGVLQAINAVYLEANILVAPKVAANKELVLDRLAEMVEADLADLYDEESGRLLPVHEWPEVWRKGLVAGIDTTQLGEELDVTITKTKAESRLRVLELLGKHVDVKAFQESVVHEHKLNIREAFARRKQAAQSNNGDDDNERPTN